MAYGMTKLRNTLRDLGAVLREMFLRPWVKFGAALTWAAGIWSTVRAEFLTEQVAKDLQLYRIAQVTGALVPVWVWAVAFAALMVFAALDYSIGIRRKLARRDNRTPEIQGVSLFQHQSKPRSFDLRVGVLVHDETAFRDEWRLDLVLGSGESVEGLRGTIAEHSLPAIGTYALTVSFPFGARIPDLAALANASVTRLTGVDAQVRNVSYPPADSVAPVPLMPWQHDDLCLVAAPAPPSAPRLIVEITKEVRESIPHAAVTLPYLWGLAIRNDGASAEFQASVKLLSGSTTHLSQGRAHRLSFREGLKQRLVTGAEDYVFFALVVWNGLYSGVLAKGLWVYDETKQADDAAVLVPIDGRAAHEVVAELEVSLASDPAMEEPWKRRYRLGPSNELVDVTQ